MAATGATCTERAQPPAALLQLDLRALDHGLPAVALGADLFAEFGRGVAQRERAGLFHLGRGRRIAHGLGLERSDILHHAWCDNGPRWRGLMLRSAEQVLALPVPRSETLAGYEIGVVGPSREPGIAFEVRAFFPGSHGLIEDPVTGSLNAALAQWLIGAGLAPRQYVARQGTCLGRAGRVHVEQDGAAIWVGGSSLYQTLSGVLRNGLAFDQRIVLDPGVMVERAVEGFGEALLVLLPLVPFCCKRLNKYITKICLFLTFFREDIGISCFFSITSNSKNHFLKYPFILFSFHPHNL